MPLSPRLDDKIFQGTMELIQSANKGIFFGTWNLTIHNETLEVIIKKTKQLRYGSSVFLPPPTDLLVGTYKNEILRLYGLKKHWVDNLVGYKSEGRVIEKGWYPYYELNAILAEYPTPILEFLFKTIWKNYNDFFRWKYYAPPPIKHMFYIFKLLENNILTLLEPNTHAKFLLTENGLYEGSANFTYSGMKINVEVYTFYLFNPSVTMPSGIIVQKACDSEVLLNYHNLFMKHIEYFQRALEIQKKYRKCLVLLKEVRQNLTQYTYAEFVSKVDEIINIIGDARVDIWSKKGFVSNNILDLPFYYSNDLLNRTKSYFKSKEEAQADISRVFKMINSAEKSLSNVPRLINTMGEILKEEELVLPIEEEYFNRLEDLINKQSAFFEELINSL